MEVDPAGIVFLVFPSLLFVIFMIIFMEKKSYDYDFEDNTNRVTIVSEKKDEQGRLHCLDNCAREYSDGRKEYWVDGVQFPADIFDDVLVRKNYSAQQILGMENAEQKSVVIRMVGYDYIINELKVGEYTVLDDVKIRSKVNGKTLYYEVIEFPLSRHNMARFVKVQDHTTEKITCLGVPRIPQTRTCTGAIAWTFGLDTWNYNPEVEA